MMTQTETAHNVVEECAAFFSVPSSDVVNILRGPAAISSARDAAALVLRWRHGMRFQDIALHLGRADHSAAHVAVKRAAERLPFRRLIAPLLVGTKPTRKTL